MESKGPLIDILLFRIADRFSQDAHEDGDLDGDLQVFYHTAQAVLHDDAKFEGEYRTIYEDPELDARQKAYEGYGCVMRHLAKNGHLDRKPIEYGEDDLEGLLGP